MEGELELIRKETIKIYGIQLILKINLGSTRKVNVLQIVRKLQMQVFIKDCINRPCLSRKLRKDKIITLCRLRKGSMFAICILKKVSVSKNENKGKSLNAPYRTTLNYGTRLYQKGIQKMEEIERKHQEEKIKKEFEELKEHTFHPKILPVSKYYGSKADEKPEDNLIKKGLLTQDKLEQKRAEVLYGIQNSNSFHPNINENSRKIADQRNQFFEDDYIGDENSNQYGPQSDQFLNLYDDAMKRVERHNKIYSMCIDSECTFKPDIGKTKHMNVSHRYNNNKNCISEKSIIEKFNNENFDPVTGQPFFHPKVNKSPINQNHRSSKSIGNLLYDATKIYKEKNDLRIQQYENEIRERSNTRATNKNSEALLDNMKNKRFAAIFNMLDSN
jgi:hypothetical protein